MFTFSLPTRVAQYLFSIALASTVIGNSEIASAAPFCPGNAPATLDPAFSPLIARVGSAAVGSAAACTYAVGDTGIFQQETTLGSLSHVSDGTLQFVSHAFSPNKIWTLLPDGTFITPDGQRVGPAPAPAPAVAPVTPPIPAPEPPQPLPFQIPDLAPVPAQSSVDASQQTTSAGAVTPGRYGCFAQSGGGTAAQVNRTGIGITKGIYADGTWRDTTYGELTATDPAYGGSWSFDGAVVTLAWYGSSQDTFTAEIGTDGSPQLVQFGAQANMTCYLIE